MTRILVADDIAENRYLLTALLRGNGFEVAVASDGAEALALAQSAPPDLIITDIMMPVMDGFELCRQWKRDERLKHIPFVVYTATYTDAKDERLALDLGADRFLIKPQKVEVLLAAVREMLEARRAPAAEARGEETDLLRRHNEALIRKLEKKVQLHGAMADDLQRTTAFLDSIIEHIPDMVFLKDARELRFVRFNRAGERLLGCSRSELLGKCDHDLFPKDQADGFVQKDREVLDRKEVIEVPEEAIITRDKGERLLHTKKVPILNAKGEPEYLLGISEDITDRKRSEAALLESAGLLRMAGRMSRLGGWSVDLDGMRVLWSDEVAAIHEVPAGQAPTLEEALGFYTPEWRAQIEEAFRICVQDGASYDEEMEIVTAGGKRLWVRTMGEAIRNAAGAVIKVQGAFQDITDRKQAEEEHRRLQRQLLASQRIESIGRLAGGIAHDFNNLLSVILSYTDFASEAVHEGDPLRADLEQISTAGRRAATLTKQLLAFSRKQILAVEVLSLNQVVAGVESMLRRLLGEDVEIAVHLAEDLGNVLADRGQIEQLIMNLVVNARDAMPGGGKLTIETANVELDAIYAEQHVAVTPGRHVLLSVTDSGCGMDAATREQIFDPFFTTKEKDKGTGLGLSIVHGVVKQSGGNLWVYSEPGIGTTFKVYLPRVDAEVVATSRRPSAASGGNEWVLIVEDEDTVRRIAERILRSAGYQVETASNGGEALLACERLGGRIDLLLTDVVMPKMNGRELSDRLASICPRLKTLYMSGYTDHAIVQNSILAPGTHLVGKPFSAAELKAKVREVLDSGPRSSDG